MWLWFQLGSFFSWRATWIWIPCRISHEFGIFCVFLGHLTCNMGSYFQDCGHFLLFNWNLVYYLFLCLCTCPCNENLPLEQGSVSQDWLSWCGKGHEGFIYFSHLLEKSNTQLAFCWSKQWPPLFYELTCVCLEESLLKHVCTQGHMHRHHVTSGCHFAWAYPKVALFWLVVEVPCRLDSGSSMLKNPLSHHHSVQLFSRTSGQTVLVWILPCHALPVYASEQLLPLLICKIGLVKPLPTFFRVIVRIKWHISV